MDFSNYEESNRYYAGSERKIGIREVSGNLYMLKFPKTRVYGFPTSQIRLNGKKSSYHEVISSRAFPECNDALSHILETLNMAKVDALVENCEFISDARKQFYSKMLKLRWRLILVNSFSRGGIL